MSTTPPKKISEIEYYQLFKNPKVSDEEILQYSLIVKGEGGFSWQVKPNPEYVEASFFKSAGDFLGLGNGLCRLRREVIFNYRRERENLPILVSEGDSWFQFPIKIREVIDQLESKYLIWSVGAAGDTASNIVYGDRSGGKIEYLSALRSQKTDVKGFLFSAAGNDIIGEHPVTKKSSLYDILNIYDPSIDDPKKFINSDVLSDRLEFLRGAYETVFNNIRNEPGFSQLPIFIHGYDYVFPYPWNEDGVKDLRVPSYAKQDQWIGKPFRQRGFPEISLRRDIMIILIDALYDMLYEVAGNSEATKIWVVNCRGAMPNVSDWNDEIHGNDLGFAKVAVRFDEVIQSVINP